MTSLSSLIRTTDVPISKANHPVIPRHPTKSAARWVQLLTPLTDPLRYAETSSTCLTLELSISPVKVREISNLTTSSEKPQTYNQIGWVTASALCQPTKPPKMSISTLSKPVHYGILWRLIEPWQPNKPLRPTADAANDSPWWESWAWLRHSHGDAQFR